MKNRKSFGLISLVLFATLPAAAQTWTNLGPDGGDIFSIAVDPKSPQTVYLVGGGGVFKSTNGGALWTSMRNGLPFPEGTAYFTNIAVDPVNSSNLYLGSHGGPSGIYKSTDGGAHWAASSTGIGANVIYDLAIDPTSSGVVYCGTEGQGVFKSSDGGGHWTILSGLPTDIRTIIVDPTSHLTLYAAGYNTGPFKSLDGGATWATANSGLPAAPIIHRIEVVPSSSTVFLATDGGLFESTNGASSWTAVTNGLSGSSFADIVATRLSPLTLYTASSAGVFKSVDGGAHWASKNTGVTAASFSQFAFDPTSPDTLYLASYGGGCFKTVNGGTNWSAANSHNLNVYVSSIAIDPLHSSTIFAGTGGGVYRSTDGGTTWTWLAGGIGNGYVAVVALAQSSPPALYAAGNGVYKSTDGGNTFSKTSATSAYAWALQVDPTAPNTVYLGTEEDGVSKTTDGGATWTRINNGLTIPRIFSLAIDPGSPSTVYAGSEDAGVFKTTDGGANWAPSTTGVTDTSITSIAVDPLHPSTVFAGGYSVFKSANAGQSWSPAGASSGYSLINAIAIDPFSPSHISVGRSGDFLRSSDGGATWTLVENGLLSREVAAVALHPVSPETVFAGTQAGVSKITFASSSPCTAGPTVLCLQGGRFRVSVTWHDQHSPTLRTGVGAAVPDTSQTGRFWFFSPDAIELLVKIIDGRSFNSSFWVFYGALSDVEYTITVIDTVDGKIKTYHNAPGNICGSADTSFSTTATSSVGDAPVLFSDAPIDPESSLAGASAHSPDAAPAAIPTPCTPSATSLCLLSNRFKVSVSWIDQHTPGHSGVGTAVASTDQTGYFWFFSADALELAVKIIDGRSLNGKFWVFYGALSDVEYTITVTDTSNGAVKTYHNAPGNICGKADTSAF